MDFPQVLSFSACDGDPSRVFSSSWYTLGEFQHQNLSQQCSTVFNQMTLNIEHILLLHFCAFKIKLYKHQIKVRSTKNIFFSDASRICCFDF